MRYKLDSNYPNWVCHTCGCKAQTDTYKIVSFFKWKFDICDICHKHEYVTTPKDFGYPQFSKLRGR